MLRLRWSAGLAVMGLVVGTLVFAPTAQAQSAQIPFGNAETIAARGPGQVQVGGWAIDPSAAGPATVRVVGYPEGAPDYARPDFQVEAVANLSRPDVGRAYPAFGPNRGFNVSISVSGGSRRVCVFIQAGFRTQLLRCQMVSSPGGNPFGNFEVLRARADGRVDIAGWAIDPDTANPTDVHLYANGRFLASTRADRLRGDVGRAFPGYGRDHGFSVSPFLGPGSHQVCAYAINVGTGWVNSLLGCRSTQIGDNADLRGIPFGNIDVLRPTAPRMAVISGWVVDRDTTQPIHLEVLRAGQVVATGASGLSRRDVARVHPEGGPNAGYRIEVPLGPGTHRLCVRATNVGRGFGNPEIACRNVTMPTGNPFGSLDDVSPVSTTELRLAGWAIDPDTLDPLEVHVYVNGAYAGKGATGRTRRDVTRAHPIYGEERGFSITVPYNPGRMQVCAYAINRGPGNTNTGLGCRDILVRVG